MDALQTVSPQFAPALGFTPHPWRGLVLGEVHARPFHPVAIPQRILHFAFLTSPDQAVAAHAALWAYCAGRGVDGPKDGARHHRAIFGDVVLSWEQHSEFATYTWQLGGQDRSPFERPAAVLSHAMLGLPQPGPHLVSTDLHLVEVATGSAFEDVFDPSRLAASAVDGAAVAGTDFLVGADGFVRYLVLDQGLNPTRAGALVQSLLELETYRVLALLGLPEAARLAPVIREIENALARVARNMMQAEGLSANRALLDEITALAAGSEAEAVGSNYRFGASRAYDGIVAQRLAAIGEEPHRDYPTFAGFLLRRMAPAMRTCETTNERMSALTQRMAHAADLLRTRVNVEIEQQNQAVLRSLDERTRIQLRMQHTVEGLSIAAISYYVIGLVGYLFKGAGELSLLPVDPGVATAAAVPLALLSVGLTVRRIRRHHPVDADEGPDNAH